MNNETTTAGAVSIVDRPLGVEKKKQKYKEFTVSNETFRRFQTGRAKFERWSKYLNLQDDIEKSIYDYYNKSRGHSVIILRDGDTGALRAIRPTSSNKL